MADTLNYRFARPDEVPEIGRLVSHSFPRPAQPPEWWIEQLRNPLWGGGPETLLIGLEDDRPVAALQIHPLEQWVGGELLPTAGIGTVTIAPTHRKRGLAAQLMETALREAHDRGNIASALYPFRYSFYSKLGYGRAGQVHQYLVPPQVLPDSPDRKRVERLESDEARAEALNCYQRWAATQNGQLTRSARVWDHVVNAPNRALFGYRNEAGTLEGYALVAYRVDLPRRDRFLEVEELAWLQPQAARGLYAWLSSLDDQWEQVLVRALPKHHLDRWISEPRLPHGAAPNWGLWTPAATLLLGPMFRLLDSHAAWARRHLVPQTALSVDFDVTDRQLPHNTGTLRLTFEDGHILMDRKGPADLTIRCDISILSCLYINAVPPIAAYEAGLLDCDRPDLLARLGAALALPEPWTFDRF